MKKIDGKQMALKSLLLLCFFAAGGCGISYPHAQFAMGKATIPAEPVVEAGAGKSWSQADSLDDNPLLQAERANDVLDAEQLLKGGANPSQNLVDTNKVIDFAADDGHVAFVRLLIRFMPELTRSQAIAYLQQAKNVALDSAVISGTVKAASSLLAEGADVNNLDGNDISGIGSPLMRASARGSLTLMSLLLAHGADVNQRDGSGRDALMYVGGINMYYASYNEEMDVEAPAARLTALPARLLLRHGADVMIRDHSGKTALMWAAQGNPQCVPFLLTHGARVDARDNSGRTALLCAASVRDAASMARLVAAGAEVNAQDKDGETPLMRASVQPESPADAGEIAERRQAIAVLQRHGANPRLKDKQQRKASDYAKMNDTDFITAS
jgi:ankyrin repeat protein